MSGAGGDVYPLHANWNDILLRIKVFCINNFFISSPFISFAAFRSATSFCRSVREEIYHNTLYSSMAHCRNIIFVEQDPFFSLSARVRFPLAVCIFKRRSLFPARCRSHQASSDEKRQRDNEATESMKTLSEPSFGGEIISILLFLRI